MPSETTALSKAYDLTRWTAERMARFPTPHRHTIGTRLVTTLLEAQELLVEAHYTREKRDLLRRERLLASTFRVGATEEAASARSQGGTQTGG